MSIENPFLTNLRQIRFEWREEYRELYRQIHKEGNPVIERVLLNRLNELREQLNADYTSPAAP